MTASVISARTVLHALTVLGTIRALVCMDSLDYSKFDFLLKTSDDKGFSVQLRNEYR